MANGSSSSSNQSHSGPRPRAVRGRLHDLRPIMREEARQVCFSKRRSGIMKKAGELCILCRAQVLIIVFSPAGRAFSFGDPSVDGIIQRFLDPEEYEPSPPDTRRQEALRKMHMQHESLTAQLEVAKKRHTQTKREVRSAGAGELPRLWDADVNDLKPEEALQLSQAVDAIHASLGKRETDLMNATATAHHDPAAHHHHQLFAAAAAATVDQGWLGFMGLNNSSHTTNLIGGNFAGASSSNHHHHHHHLGFGRAANQPYGADAAGWYVNPHSYPPTNAHVANNFYIGGSFDSAPFGNLPRL